MTRSAGRAARPGRSCPCPRRAIRLWQCCRAQPASPLPRLAPGSASRRSTTRSTPLTAIRRPRGQKAIRRRRSGSGSRSTSATRSDCRPTSASSCSTTPTGRSIANQLRVTTSAGSAVSETVSTAGPAATRAGRADQWLRITITGASNVVPGDPGAGITDVLIPGVRVTRYLQAAEDPAGAKTSAVVYLLQPAVCRRQQQPGPARPAHRILTASLHTAGLPGSRPS